MERNILLRDIHCIWCLRNIKMYLTEIEVVVHNDFVVNFRQRCYEISYAGVFHSTVVRYASLYKKYEYVYVK